MRTIYLIAFLLFFLIADSVNAQQVPPSIVWQKCLGGTAIDYAMSIQQSIDSGYIIAGYTQSNNGDVSGNHDTTGYYYDYWIVLDDVIRIKLKTRLLLI